MTSSNGWVETLKSRLRGTIVHRIYGLFRHELPMIALYRVYYSVKRNGKFDRPVKYIRNRFRRFYLDLPKAIAIDIVSCCNLRCPLCSVPPFITKKDDNFMPLHEFKYVVDGIEDLTSDLSLVYAGEPFLHPAFFEMLDYASRDYYTTTITNGTLLNEKAIQRLLGGGLDFIQISFDGFSKDSYEKYRIGADFEKVKRNIENFLKERNRQRHHLPHVTITYLINSYNEDEVEICHNYFNEIGVDKFYAKAINLNAHRRLDGKTEEDLKHWLPKKKSTTLYDEISDNLVFKERNGRCSICDTPIIRCDGEVLICCHDIFNSVKIGNVLKKPFRDLWFSNDYKRKRVLARKRRLTVCQRCGK